MERKILVAVDDSMHSRTSLSYLKTLMEGTPDLSMTLFHVQPAISDFLVEESKKSFEGRRALEKVIEKNRQAAVEILDRCKAMLMRSGVSPEKVVIETSPMIAGMAKDIIDKGLAGQFDAIVAGRRGLSGLQKWMLGSVSSRLVEHSPIPVWIVGTKSFNHRVLVAVDGSPSSLKALEHVLFMISADASAGITLFHIRPTLADYSVADLVFDPEPPQSILEKGNRTCMDDFYRQVRRRLEEYRVEERRMAFLEVDRKNGVAQTILKASKEHDYRTVVVGKRGTGRSFFMGSVSSHIINKGVNCAVWIVP